MRRKHYLMALGLLATGCASLPPEADFESLAGDIRQRTGHELQQRDLGDSLDDRVNRLLEEPLTMAAAVQLGLLNSPELQSSLAQLDVGIAEWLETMSLENPSLELSILDPEEEGADSIEAELLAPVIDLILRAPRRGLADLELRQVRAEAIEAVIELAAEIESGWYGYLAAEQKAAIAELMLEAAEVGHLLAERFKRAGNITDLALALHQDTVGMARAELAEASLELADQRLELSRLMGLDASADWAAAGPLAGIPDYRPDRDTLERQMLAEHPSIAVADLELEKLGLALGLERRFRWLGDIDVGVAYERETDRSELYGVALELQLPIFNQGQAEIQAARARLARAGWSRRATRARLTADLQRAIDQVGSAADRAAIWRDTIIPARKAAVDFLLGEYNYMITGVFDVIEARKREFEAYNRYIDDVSDFWMAMADLRRAAGGGLAVPSGPPLHLPTLEPRKDGMDHSPMQHDEHRPQESDGGHHEHTP